MSYLFSQHEQHGHHDMGQVMMPGFPFPNLVIGHPAFSLCILESTFDKISLALAKANSFKLVESSKLHRGIFISGFFPIDWVSMIDHS
jgi:hypothetical protein